MPLSERERRVLEEIERGLYQEDPTFARGVGHRRPRLPGHRRRRLGVVLFAAGFVLLLTFFVTRAIPLGVAAFGAMVTGMVLVAGTMFGNEGDSERGSSRPSDRLVRVFTQWEERIKRRRKGS